MTVRRTPKRPGPGSFRVLEWVARLGVAGIASAQAALGIQRTAMYSHVARLVETGFLWRAPVIDGRGSVVVVTRAGAREARERCDRPVVSPRSSAPHSARHGREVSWVAAFLELGGIDWVGPAELRRVSGWRSQSDDGARHSPDLGIVHADQRRTAVEIELHAKSNDRLDNILAGYRELIRGEQLADVTYVTDRRSVSELVRRRAAAALVADYIHIRSLEQIIVGTRARATAGPLAEAGSQ